MYLLSAVSGTSRDTFPSLEAGRPQPAELALHFRPPPFSRQGTQFWRPGGHRTQSPASTTPNPPGRVPARVAKPTQTQHRLVCQLSHPQPITARHPAASPAATAPSVEQTRLLAPFSRDAQGRLSNAIAFHESFWVASDHRPSQSSSAPDDGPCWRPIWNGKRVVGSGRCDHAFEVRPWNRGGYPNLCATEACHANTEPRSGTLPPVTAFRPDEAIRTRPLATTCAKRTH